ncbi:hypothetical protein POPTR_006G239802v4 [Populus trichocarpa]|uniref:Uncharacterized protein n=2 Tax=Populus trichocarpa TaxID=3694 RepID=A0ACC0SW59_POPTR|nr:hypothetical protein POPTR_006G239802v4 [Populus trichocarpa]KAI9393473.1 hypothetical protein POPTR_006G239802v4 [Populus trichocarpa]
MTREERMLHGAYNVGDLDKAIKFYTEFRGMKLLRKRDVPEDRYSNAFLGYGPEDSTLELTYRELLGNRVQLKVELQKSHLLKTQWLQV